MSEEKKTDAEAQSTAEEVTQEDAPKNEETTEVVSETKESEEKPLPHRDLRPGMIVRVHERIVDVNNKGEEKSRIQIFEGMIIGIKSPGISRTMTVRKNSNGFMVEKIYPLASPNVTKVEIVKQHKVRRAKLGFLRGTFKRKMKEKK